MFRGSSLVCYGILAVSGWCAGAQELITNGDFEAGQTPWNREVTDEEAHSGTHSIKLDNTEGVNWAAVAYSPVVPLRPHTPYRMTVWVKRVGGDGYLEIGGFPVDAAGERLVTGQSWKMVLYPIKVMTGQALGHWRKFETVFTVHRPDIAGLTVRLVHRRASDIIYFDDFSIEEVSLPPAPELTFPEAVTFPGHPSDFHMRVESVEATDAHVRVVTTGAEYEFTPEGAITGRQRIGAQRQVISIQSDQAFGDMTVTHRDDDVCVIEGDQLAFGVQGDSLIALATNRALGLTVTSGIGANHLSVQGPHLLAVDDDGGFVISHDFSKIYQTAGCQLTDLPDWTGESGWACRYLIGERERVGIAVFPPRPYDFETAFGKRLVNVTGLISDEHIRFYNRWCNVLMHFDASRLYDKCRDPVEGRGPYVFLDPESMHHSVQTCHDLGIQVICYSNTEGEGNLWYGDDVDAYFAHLQAVTEEYDLDGWYFDGVFVRDGWSVAYSFMRRMREMVGPDGLIYNHCTLNPPLTRDDLYMPFIDAYATWLLRGEGQGIAGVNAPYMRYVINSNHISNAIPTLKWDKIEDAGLHDIFRAMLSFHGRFRWAYPTVPADQTSWQGESPEGRAAIDREFLEYYFPELDRQEALWRAGLLDTGISWPIQLGADGDG